MPCFGLGLSGKGFCDGTDIGTSATLYRTLVRLLFGESIHMSKSSHMNIQRKYHTIVRPPSLSACNKPISPKNVSTFALK